MIVDKINKLKTDFNTYDSWEDRYRHIIKIGKGLEGFDEQYQVEKYKIKGCQSQVWLKPELVDGKMKLSADSDSVLVKGIVGILLQVYGHEAPSDILKNPPAFLGELGITEHLSMNRTNSLASMVKQIQLYAQLFESLIEKGVLNASP